MKLSVTNEILGVCRLDPSIAFPDWVIESKFLAITKTMDELSIVCETKFIPPNLPCEKEWRAFKVQGPLDFGLTGILASLATPLAEAKISLFAISTFDTDYILVKNENLESARKVLHRAGFEIN